MSYQPRFFQPVEWRCKCGICKGPTIYDPLDDDLLIRLDLLRWALGTPITITSGWRCETHNRRIGGVADSRHLTGHAAYITSKTMFPTLVTLVRNLHQMGYWKFRFFQVNAAKRYIHIDV